MNRVGKPDRARKPKIKAGERPTLKYAAFIAARAKGETALKAVAQSQHEMGTKYAKAQIKSGKIKGRDAKAAGAVYETLLQGLSIEHNIIESTDKSFVISARGCPFLKVWKGKGVDASKLCESFGKSFVQGLCECVNPKLKYSVSKTMSKEDSYCEERIELVS